MLKHVLSAFALILTSAFAAGSAQANANGIVVVNFTADWCPTCKTFDPRLKQAVRSLNDPDIAHISVDMTKTRTGSQFERAQFWSMFQQELETAGIGALHKGYLGFANTGYAIIIAQDTQEPLDCFLGNVVPLDGMYRRLQNAKTRVQQSQPFKRTVKPISCPPSFDYLKTSANAPSLRGSTIE